MRKLSDEDLHKNLQILIEEFLEESKSTEALRRTVTFLIGRSDSSKNLLESVLKDTQDFPLDFSIEKICLSSITDEAELQVAFKMPKTHPRGRPYEQTKYFLVKDLASCSIYIRKAMLFLARTGRVGTIYLPSNWMILFLADSESELTKTLPINILIDTVWIPSELNTDVGQLDVLDVRDLLPDRTKSVQSSTVSNSTEKEITTDGEIFLDLDEDQDILELYGKDMPKL